MTASGMAAQGMGLIDILEHAGFVGWMTFAVVAIMGLATLYYIIRNTIKNIAVRSNAENVVTQFWATTNPQEAIRAMESFPANEPFS